MILTEVHKIQSSDRWEVVVARNCEQIEAIREAWDHIHGKEPHPTLDSEIDRFLSVVKSLGPDVQPYVILVKREDRPVAMVVGRIERHRLEFKFGYKVLGAKTLKCLTVVYGGILGGPDEALCLLLLGELRKHLKSREYDIVYFNYLKTQECFYRSIGKVFGFMTRGCKPRIEEHWRMLVPERIDQFYAARSHKHRANLRRAIRKFEKDHPSHHDRVVEYSTESDVSDFIRIASGISTKTYQGAMSVGLVDDEQTHHLLTKAARLGWLRGHVLFAGDIACSFQLGLAYREVYYLVNIGYDPDFQAYLPGTVLFLKVLESLCDDPSIHTMDFYFGDAWYKQSYGTEHWPEAIIYVFAPRWTLSLLNLLQGSLMGINSSLAYIVKKVGSLNWIKRRWRDRLKSKK